VNRRTALHHFNWNGTSLDSSRTHPQAARLRWVAGIRNRDLNIAT